MNSPDISRVSARFRSRWIGLAAAIVSVALIALILATSLLASGTAVKRHAVHRSAIFRCANGSEWKWLGRRRAEQVCRGGRVRAIPAMRRTGPPGPPGPRGPLGPRGPRGRDGRPG